MYAFKDVFFSKKFIMGPKVNELEKTLAEYTHTAEAIGVSSGTDALLVSLMALDIQPGDEIILRRLVFFLRQDLLYV